MSVRRRNRMWMRSKVLLVALVAGLGAVALTPCTASAQNLLADGHFATGVAGWSLEGDPAIGLAWNPSLGNPAPGSLLLARSEPGLGYAEALSECFDPPPGATYQVRALIYSTAVEGVSSTRCDVFISRYTDPGCTGDRVVTGFSGSVPLDVPGVWSERRYEEQPTDRPSFRVALLARLVTTDGPVSCNFDSVVLTDQQATPVPGASTAGLLVLAVLIVALGLRFLRSA